MELSNLQRLQKAYALDDADTMGDILIQVVRDEVPSEEGDELIRWISERDNELVSKVANNINDRSYT